VLDPADAPSRARKITRKDDVIYSCVRPYLLNVAVVDDDFVPEPIASTAFAVLNGYGLVHPRYLWIALRSPFMVECVEAEQRGQAYPAINDSDFAVLPFPLPPLPEQHRIVAKVDELMALCDRMEVARNERESRRDRLVAASLYRLSQPADGEERFRADARFYLNHLPRLTTCADHVRQLRQTIFNLAVRGRLVPQNPNDEPASELLNKIAAERRRLLNQRNIRQPKHQPYVTEDASYDLPDNWMLCTLGDLTIVTDPNPSHRYPDYAGGTVPLLSTQDFYGEDGLKSRMRNSQLRLFGNSRTVSVLSLTGTSYSLERDDWASRGFYRHWIDLPSAIRSSLSNRCPGLFRSISLAPPA
jgi:type I restriction enzyme S subunit